MRHFRWHRWVEHRDDRINAVRFFGSAPTALMEHNASFVRFLNKFSSMCWSPLNRKPVVSYVEPSAIESLSRIAIRDLKCHLMTLSARPSTLCGIVKPICFAVLRFITRSNFIGCSTGISAGLIPFRILSTYRAPSRPSVP